MEIEFVSSALVEQLFYMPAKVRPGDDGKDCNNAIQAEHAKVRHEPKGVSGH